MTKEDWKLIKAYTDAKIVEEIDRRLDEESGVWCGESDLHAAERLIEEHLNKQ